MGRRTITIAGNPGIAADVEGSGALVVFLHGIGGNRGSWRDQLSPFAERYTAVAWDARGYGDSGDYDGPLDFSDVCGDLVRLLDRFGVSRAHLVGLSMGGRIAQQFYYAHSARVATLTLADTHPGFAHLSTQQREEYIRLRKEPLERGLSPSDIAPELVARLVGPHAGAEVRQRLHESIAALRKDAYLKTLEATVRQHRIGDPSTIAVPVHFIVGAHDRLATPQIMREMSAQVTGSEFTVIEDAGHLTNMEQPRRFNAVALEFIDRHAALADAPAPMGE